MVFVYKSIVYGEIFKGLQEGFVGNGYEVGSRRSEVGGRTGFPTSGFPTRFNRKERRVHAKDPEDRISDKWIFDKV